jgi:hypothetical protein
MIPPFFMTVLRHKLIDDPNSIRVRKTDLYWQLVNDSLMTQVRNPFAGQRNPSAHMSPKATVGPKRNDNKDKWIFIPIL